MAVYKRQGNDKVQIADREIPPSPLFKRGAMGVPFKKGEHYEKTCFLLSTKYKFPPFLKGG